MLCEQGLKNVNGIQQCFCGGNDSITVYPCCFFAPINVITGRLHVTENTRTIHRYMGSWSTSKVSAKRCGMRELLLAIRANLPESVLILMNKIKRRNYRIS